MGGLLPEVYRYKINGRYIFKAVIPKYENDYPRMEFYSSGYGALTNAVVGRVTQSRYSIGIKTAVRIFYKINTDETITEYFQPVGGNVAVYSKYPLEISDSIPEDATEIKE